MTQSFETPPAADLSATGTSPLGGAAPPEAGVLPGDETRTEQVRGQAAQVAGEASTQAANVAGTAADSTREVARQATSAAEGVAATSVEQATQVQQEALAQVRNLVHDASQQVREQAEAQTSRAADGLSSLSDQLRALVDGRPDEAAMIRDYLQDGADKLSAFSDRLQTNGLEGTLQEVQHFARRHPGVFLLGALGLGVGVGRLLRGAQAASSASNALATGGPGPAATPTEVRGTLGVPGADGYEVPPTDVVPPLPLNVPVAPEVAAVSPLLADDPTVPVQQSPLGGPR